MVIRKHLQIVETTLSTQSSLPIASKFRVNILTVTLAKNRGHSTVQVLIKARVGAEPQKEQKTYCAGNSP